MLETSAFAAAMSACALAVTVAADCSAPFGAGQLWALNTSSDDESEPILLSIWVSLAFSCL